MADLFRNDKISVVSLPCADQAVNAAGKSFRATIARFRDRSVQAVVLLATLLFCCAGSAISEPGRYASTWDSGHDGAFVAPEIWSNPLHEWRVNQGALECFSAGSDRNIYLLTHEIETAPTIFKTSVDIAPLPVASSFRRIAKTFSSRTKTSFVGFRFGVSGFYSDYRDRAFYGVGSKAGVSLDGKLFIGEMNSSDSISLDEPFTLSLSAEPTDGSYRVTLSARDRTNNTLAEVVHENFPSDLLIGGLGLTCHSGPEIDRMRPEAQRPRFPKRGVESSVSWRDPEALFSFRKWSVESDALVEHSDRAYGPINFALYTTNDTVLKLTAQMMPLSAAAGTEVELALKMPGSNSYSHVQTAEIDPEAYTAHFRLEGWNSTNNVPYRIIYRMQDKDGGTKSFSFDGTIRAEPEPGSELTLASLSCQFDEGFPHQELQDHVLGFDPDIAVFTGDQIYEFNAGYGIVTEPFDAARLDYLRKWYQFGWAFRDLLRDRPSVLLPDDHDVNQGGVWGEGGKALDAEPYWGGYQMSPRWLNMMQRTQTSHLPDPYDPTPVKQGIGVYYTDLTYGGVSFAILEDRKWKSGPQNFFSPSWIKWKSRIGLQFDPATDANVEGAELLGDRQLDFLENWATDWSGDTRMKAVISQTPFVAPHTYRARPKDIFSGVGAPPMKQGAYPESDVLAVDFESNGWPQTPRNKALELMRKAFALHISGDTHLGAMIQYGIDEWQDGPWVAVSPAISNVVARRWYPSTPPENSDPNGPRNLGNFRDAFGNLMTYRAVANSIETGIAPERINDLAPGYNIITFDTSKQTIEVAAWPRWVDPKSPSAAQFEGWPVTLSHTDNGYPATGPALPPIEDLDIEMPVVQVINETSGEVVYTVRMQGPTIEPHVFAPGTYTVRVFDADMALVKDLTAQATD